MFSGFGFSRSGGGRADAGSGRVATAAGGGARNFDDEHHDAQDYDDDEEHYDNNDLEGGNYDDDEEEPEQYDGNILSSDQEKSKVLVMFKDLRNDAMFCDITFLCQGKEFRAHKVVVSAWSRWLRSLLCEEQPTEDVIHVDVFDPLSFGKVLDYMYGTPLSVTVDTAEALLKVIRRLQLQALEESIWIFLMKIVGPNNAEQLHTLADRYDCPPLKLSAWRIMQESVPGYSSLPAGILAASAAGGVFKGTGLTGPGDPDFLTNQKASALADPAAHGEHADDMPSIFTHFSPPPPSAGEEDQDNVDDKSVRRRAGAGATEHKEFSYPKELPSTASASELVKAWSARLQEVYQKCNAPEGDKFADPETMESKRGKKIILGGAAGRGLPGSPKTTGKKKDPSSPTKYSHIREINWYSELRQFYLGINMPEKLPGIHEILLTWKGKEEQMLSHLITKYKRSIPHALAEHLNTLSQYVETQSESSFVR